MWEKKDWQIEYSRHYELNHTPKGLFSRLMIRLLNFSHGVVYWQNGILLKDASGKALVELHYVNALTKGMFVMMYVRMYSSLGNWLVCTYV